LAEFYRQGVLTFYTETCKQLGMGPRKERTVRWDGERVRSLRTHLGMTQQEMAGQLGTRQQTVSEWETGLYRPRGASNTLLNLVAERSGFKYRVRRKKKIGEGPR
jgi:DNA-binding transcriptional regulator YiaG